MLPVVLVRLDLVGHPLLEQPVLQGEHLPLFVGFAVVVAEQMQHTVDGEQRQFVPEAVACRGGLFGGELRAQHDVAQHGRARLRRIGATTRLELIHREAHHVRRAGQVHPAHVQIGHGRGVQQHHGQLGRRVDVHPGDDEFRDADQFGFGDVDARLVGYLDAHKTLTHSSSTIAAAGCPPSRPVQAGAGLLVPGIGVDDLRHQPVPDDVLAGQLGDLDVLDVLEDADRRPQP